MQELAKLTPHPDHVILEASGVAIPGSIASAISILDQFLLAGVLVLANAETVRDQIADTYIGDTITRQLADADLVILNKTDLAPPGEIETICNLLTEFSGGADVLQSKHCKLPIAVVLQNLSERSASTSASTVRHINHFKSQYFEMNSEVDAHQLACELASPKLDLVRAKGFVTTTQGVKTLQIVGRRWAVSDAPDGVSPGLVVIGRKTHFDLTALQELLGKYR